MYEKIHFYSEPYLCNMLLVKINTNILVPKMRTVFGQQLNPKYTFIKRCISHNLNSSNNYENIKTYRLFLFQQLLIVNNIMHFYF